MSEKDLDTLDAAGTNICVAFQRRAPPHIMAIPSYPGYDITSYSELDSRRSDRNVTVSNSHTWLHGRIELDDTPSRSRARGTCPTDNSSNPIPLGARPGAGAISLSSTTATRMEVRDYSVSGRRSPHLRHRDGYFEIGSFSLDLHWRSSTRFRVLMGDEVSRRTQKARRWAEV